MLITVIQLREVEIKRLRVELQVSNNNNATNHHQHQQQQQLQDSTYTIHYQPNILTTPYSNSLSRTVAFLSAAGSSPTGSYKQSGSRESKLSAAGSSPTGSYKQSGSQEYKSKPTHSPGSIQKSASPYKHTNMSINVKHSPSKQSPCTTISDINYNQSVYYATTILKQILQQQTEHINLVTNNNITPMKYNHNNFFQNSVNSTRKYLRKSPSTNDIHTEIMKFIEENDLDPKTHYASIVKAIKIQVLSQLLSRDLNQKELQETAILLSVTSPTTTNTAIGNNTTTNIETSQRLQRYFNDMKSPVSPIPLSETLDQPAPVRENTVPRDTGNSGLRRNKRVLYIDATQTATEFATAVDTATTTTGSAEISPITPHTTATTPTTTTTTNNAHNRENNNKTHSSTTSPTIKPKQSPIKPNSKHSTHHKKPWVGNKTQTPRQIPPSTATTATISPIQLQRLAVKSLHSAVSALSASYQEDFTLKGMKSDVFVHDTVCILL